MRYLFLAMFLVVATIAPAQQYPTAAELLEILTELNEGMMQLWQGEQILKKGLDLSIAGLDESKKQVKNLRTSFDDYKTETAETVRKMRIGLFALGAGCIISLLVAVIT